MNLSKILVAGLFGLLLGVAASHVPMVKAGPQETSQVHLYVVPIGMTGKVSFSENLPGGRIAGISCLPKPTAQLPDAAICYVATTLQ